MSKSMPDPRELLAARTGLSAPRVSSDNPVERGWYPRDRGLHRAERV